MTALKLTSLVVVALGFQAASSGNLLSNGSFDRDVSGWKLSQLRSDAWIDRGDGLSGAARVINDDDVTRAALTSVKDGVIDSAWQCVQISRDSVYQLSALGRVPIGQSVDGYGALTVIWWETSNCSMRPDGTGLIGAPISVRLKEIDDRWHALSLPTLQAPAGARAVMVALDAVVAGAQPRGDFEVWFDDVVLSATASRPHPAGKTP